MKRALILLLVVAACSRAPEAADTPAAPAAKPVTDSWPGKYEGDLIVKVDAAHKVMLIEGQADGCTGDIGLADGGLATKPVSANELELSVQPEGIALCTVRIRKDGDKLTVSESETCSAFHGATCSFNGTAVRMKAH
ncbi:MAG: hypothetical protein JF615_11980 [Asticcacaulis sp.]|nr:hypothetical protein [Asticcacaulis sp.]